MWLICIYTNGLKNNLVRVLIASISNNCTRSYNFLSFNNLYEVLSYSIINSFDSCFNTSVLSDSAKWVKFEFKVWFNSLFWKGKQKDIYEKIFPILVLMSFLWSHSTLNKRIQAYQNKHQKCTTFWKLENSCHARNYQ